MQRVGTDTRAAMAQAGFVERRRSPDGWAGIERRRGRRSVLSERLTRSQVMLRCVFLLQLSMTMALAYLVPNSMTAELVAAGGIYSRSIVSVMLVVNVLAAVDLVINDLLPDGVMLLRLRAKRWLIWMVAGCLYFMHAWLAVGYHLSDNGLLTVYYVLLSALMLSYGKQASVRPDDVV